MTEATTSPRRLVRALTLVRDGLPSAGRYPRYLASLAIPVAVIWCAAVLYLLIAPVRYASNFTLILPTAGIGSTLNVESIGQAQLSASSAFGSPTLSPTENYKRLLMADITRRHAAQASGDAVDDFPDPVVKLIDQTNLIEVSVTGAFSRQAEQRALALRNAFLLQLESLRRDEAAKREVADVRHLRTLELKVRDAQQKLLVFQAASGLVSLDQFNNRIASLDALRDKEREVRTAYRVQSAQTGRYAGVLGTGMAGSNETLRLKSDPVFQKLVETYAALNAVADQKSATLGERHSALVQADSERDTLRAALVQRGRELTGLDEMQLMRRIDLSVSDGRATLLGGMVTSEAQRAGIGAGLATLRGDIARQAGRSGQLVAQASTLADLVRDHRIAEAVFSSALARIDTNKQDPFASYPLVQTLEEPSRPVASSSPSKIAVVVGALIATLLTLMGFGLLWLRQPIIRKIFPNA